ncbi:MAG: UDP-N-acetylglucosamine 2-epimerase (non-hydrolyzing) [Bacteroidetes bacterium]|nr:UDP-N-acetylglucosamine 2-epimerase (non-hydrolyzing) [Bacteroidota bacterium]MBP6414705.1 UDP-N-acetylglucosamine 2-epimerase (non-hydrolyzing) [Bacteroidia bacterium]
MGKKKKILIVIGTRPNFIKITQFKKEAKKFPNLEIKVVHTGQHYDTKMADVFFEQFNLVPDYFLNIAPSTANKQMAEIISKLEDVLIDHKPDWVIVVGDVNSTFAAALTANKLDIKIAHLESGLRSFDKSMPEEHNRILTDAISDLFFVTEQSGLDNLLKEGKTNKNTFMVGNTMIDTMVAFSKQIEKSTILRKIGLQSKEFVLMTMHRPATVDTKEGLQKLIGLIDMVTRDFKVVFPIHPRTVSSMEYFNLHQQLKNNPNLIITDPLDYFSFQKLIKESKFIITDSGGIQEETTFLQIPCLTLRSNTERPITITIGSNELIAFDLKKIKSKINTIVNGTYKAGKIPKYWDGKSTERIIKILTKN